jgi:hypothetical protein
MELQLKMAKMIGTQKAYANFTETNLNSFIRVYGKYIEEKFVLDALQKILDEHREQMKKTEEIDPFKKEA